MVVPLGISLLIFHQIDFAGIDESDSDSSAGENDQNSEHSDDEDEEDIPMSDLEDLDEGEKEDIIPHQRLTINNTVALTAALKRIALPTSKLPFSEHQSVTTSEPVSIPDVSDDLNRELAFYAQSLSAVQDARKSLKAEGVPFTRPTDYFAEMVKADEHMAKIKAKLIDEAAGKKASAEARKQRDLKKFGKQVQVAKLQERDKERKQTMEKIKVLKRSMPTTAACSYTIANLWGQNVKVLIQRRQTKLICSMSQSMMRSKTRKTREKTDTDPINARRRTRSSASVARSGSRRVVTLCQVVI